MILNYQPPLQANRCVIFHPMKALLVVRCQAYFVMHFCITSRLLELNRSVYNKRKSKDKIDQLVTLLLQQNVAKHIQTFELRLICNKVCE